MLFLLEVVESYRANRYWPHELRAATLLALGSGLEGSQFHELLVKEAARQCDAHDEPNLFGTRMNPGSFVKFKGLGLFQRYDEKRETGGFPQTRRRGLLPCALLEDLHGRPSREVRRSSIPAAQQEG